MRCCISAIYQGESRVGSCQVGWKHAGQHHKACTTWRNMKYSQNLGNKQVFPSVTLKLILLLKFNYELIGSLNTGCTVPSLERHDPACICSTTIGEERI